MPYSADLPDFSVLSLVLSLLTAIGIAFWFILSGNLILFDKRVSMSLGGMIVVVQFLTGSVICYLILSLLGLLGLLSSKAVIINLLIVSLINIFVPFYRSQLRSAFFKIKSALSDVLNKENTGKYKILKIGVIIIISYQFLLTLFSFPYVHDAVGYYLYAAKMWSIYGDLRPLWETFINNLQFYPIFTEVFYTVCFVFDDTGTSAKLIHHLFGWTVIITGYAITKHFIHRKAGWFFLLFTVTFPPYASIMNSGKLDLVFTAFALAAVYYFFCYRMSLISITFIFLFLFVSIIAKVTAAFFVLPFFLIIMWQYLRAGKLLVLSKGIVYVLIPICLIALPWITRSWIYTSTPFYSFIRTNDVHFKAENPQEAYWANHYYHPPSSDNVPEYSTVLPPFQLSSVGIKLKKVLWDWAMGNFRSVVEISPVVLYGSLMALIFMRRRESWFLFILAFSPLGLFLLISPEYKPVVTRYIFPAVFMMVICTAMLFYMIIREYKNKVLLQFITVLFILQGVRYGMHDSNILPFFQHIYLRTLGDKELRQQYFLKMTEGRGIRMFAFLNAKQEKFSVLTNGFLFRFYSNHPLYDRWSFVCRLMKTVKDDSIKAEILAGCNIKYIIFNTSNRTFPPLLLNGENVAELNSSSLRELKGSLTNKWSTDILKEDFFNKFLKLVYANEQTKDFIFEFTKPINEKSTL